MTSTPRPDQSIFQISGPSAVTYDVSSADESLLTLPPGSAWTSGPHWHVTHTEFLQVMTGRAEIVLSGTVLAAVGPADGIITVPRGAVHEWCRSRTQGLDEDLVVREWTEPRDGQKRLFFLSLGNRKLDALEAGEGSWADRTMALHVLNIFWRMDNYPLFLSPSRPGWLQGLVSRAALMGSAVAGWVLGCRGVYD